ncbi:pupal cuticle protein-like [Venturia canescens]|uniref:pupal cuticle protein-like n=1 Tax=Venturia canescens TaxID=32260 RepID=UPI001C9CD7EE|nr:pupal cuticle protein-like [Venturia canescens]
MQTFIVLSALVAVAVAAPGYLAPVYSHYAYHSAAPIGHDGRVVDTPEVEHAKQAHLAAHASEAARNSYGYAYAPALAYAASPAYVSYPAHHGYVHPAPLAADGRVVDTPEVAHAKAAHLAAHAQEAAKTAGHGYGALAYSYSPVYAYGYGSAAPLGHDGRVIDTPEVAHAKAAHFAAHAAASH